MWGGVGRGKSMLMDLFHDTLNIREKRRVHFHAFMMEVHEVMREVRKKEPAIPSPGRCKAGTGPARAGL
jgi:cell division protein ZapE